MLPLLCRWLLLTFEGAAEPGSRAFALPREADRLRAALAPPFLA